MNEQEFLEKSERTERKFPDGKDISSYVIFDIVMLLAEIQATGEGMDVFKKSLIYDKSVSLASVLEDTTDRRNEIWDRFYAEHELLEEFHIDQDRFETLHALIGKVSEMVEMVECLMPYIFGGELDVTNLGEELGDDHWYNAILHRKFNLNDDVIKSAVIKKLEDRYPDKFTTHAANNRDLKTERATLESNL